MKQISFLFSSAFLMSLMLSLNSYAQEPSPTTINVFTIGDAPYYTTEGLSCKLEIWDFDWAQNYYIVRLGVTQTTFVSNVSYSYPTGGPIWKELTFTLNAGNVTANVQVQWGTSAQVSVRVTWSMGFNGLMNKHRPSGKQISNLAFVSGRLFSKFENEGVYKNPFARLS